MPPCLGGVSVATTWCRHPSMVSNNDSWAAACGRFPADQEPGAFRPACGVEQSGDLADLGVFAQVTVGVDGGDPAGRGSDRLPDRFGDRSADTEPDVQLPFTEAAGVGEETVAGTSRIRTQQDRGAVPVSVGDLGEGLVQNSDVVSGGVRPGPALAQQPGGASPVLARKHSSGWNPEWQITMVASMSRTRSSTGWPATVGCGRSPEGVGVLGPGDLTGLGLGGPQLGQHRGVELRQQSPRRRIRCDRTEQGCLIMQHSQIGDGLTAVGEHHCEIDRDPARVMPALPLPQPGQCQAERAG